MLYSSTTLFLSGGARRVRTADLLHAMQALSQLSYGPLDCFPSENPNPKKKKPRFLGRGSQILNIQSDYPRRSPAQITPLLLAAFAMATRTHAPTALAAATLLAAIGNIAFMEDNLGTNVD